MPKVSAVAPSVAVGTPERDDDNEGIVNRGDRCPGSSSGGAVDVAGCAVFDGTIEGVNFKPGSAELTVEAMQALDGVIDLLNTCLRREPACRHERH